MYIEKILKAADFSKETNFKDELYSEFEAMLSDGEIDDEKLLNVVAARNSVTVPVNHQTKINEQFREDSL